MIHFDVPSLRRDLVKLIFFSCVFILVIWILRSHCAKNSRGLSYSPLNGEGFSSLNLCWFIGSLLAFMGFRNCSSVIPKTCTLLEPGVAPAGAAAPNNVCLRVKVGLVLMEPVSEGGDNDIGLVGLGLRSEPSRAAPSASTFLCPSVGSISDLLCSCC